MKSTRLGIALLVLFMIGITIFARFLIQQEERQKIESTLNKGDYLVSLIALYPLGDLKGEKRNYFLRTLTEYTSYEGLAYLFIHDERGRSLISLVPQDLASKIPEKIHRASIYTTGLLKQSFKVGGSDDKIYEFAKPIYEKGERAGIVRLGLKVPPVSYFSMERLSLMGMMAFFIFATISVGYYGITLALSSVKNLNQNIRNIHFSPEAAGTGSTKRGQIAPVLEDLERSLNQFKKKLSEIETDNVELASRLGVLTFEKNQIVKILDSINFGVIITDIQDNVIHINDFMIRLLNRAVEDVIDHPLGEILDNDDIRSFISQHEAIGQTRTMDHIETTFPGVNPEEIFQVALSYMHDSEGVVIGKVILVKNVAMEKSAEKAKHEFIAHVAHELRAPLTTIKSYNEMLMGGEIDDDETQKEFYNTINEETDRLAGLIENLLSISKIEMGSLALNTGLTKTDWLGRDCIAAVEAPAQKKQITIEKKLPDKFPSLVGDKELLKVALINILGNAVKYTPEKGTITFGLTERENTIIFDIADTGYGISAEDLPRIFEKFHRSSDPNVNEETGSGLGLSITSEIIKLHFGKIDVQSEPLQGSRFTITLPMEQFYLGT